MARPVSDVRLGLRSLRRAPGFTTTAILTLGLGIGLASAVFTVADAVILRRLPVPDQSRIVVLAGEAPTRGMDNFPLDLERARRFARTTRALRRTAFFLYNGAVPVAMRDGGRVSRLHVALVSGDYLPTLGARPVLGRVLRPEDDVEGAAPVMVLSHRAWRERFGGASDAVGRSVAIHEYARRFTIVGVMPAGLDFPRGTDAWLPALGVVPASAAQYLSFDLIGRLAPGATPADARAEMTEFFRRDPVPEFGRDVRGVARSLPDLVVGDTRAAVLAFAAAALVLLLITCVNVASLLLVRGLARVREAAIRLALGASRQRVVAQLLTEHALLAVGGGVVGVLVAAAAVRAFVALAPAALPRLDEIALDGGSLAGAFAITAVAMLLFAVAPAVLASRVEVQEVLRSGARQSSSRRARLTRELLVAAQVALAVLVLSAAGLVGRSALRLQHADLAFDPSGVVVAELALRGDGYENAGQQRAMLERLAAIPGGAAVSPVVSVPYASTRSWEGRPSPEERTPDEAARDPMIDMEVVDPGFFATLGLPVVRGRAFSDGDAKGAPPVVMLSASAARRYWPGGDPIGKRLRVDGNQLATVVGIVPDPRYRDLRQPRATIYFPLRQSIFPFAPTTLVLRTTRAAGDVAADVRAAIAETAPDVTLASITPFDALLAGPLAQPRMNAMLLAVFAAAAVGLAGVGLFGVLATMVRLRRRELGIRMALGAAPAQLARLVVRRGLALAAVGAIAGVLGALGVNRLLSALLFEISPSDGATLSAVTALVLVIAASASVLPAVWTTRIDPATALRVE